MEHHWLYILVTAELWTTLLSLLIRDGNLYSMGLSLWAKAGSHIRLTGEDMNIYTWQVESDVPQQKIWQLFVKDSRPLLNLLQMNSWEQKKLMRAYKREESKEEKAKMMTMLDSLERIENRLEVRIDSNVIERMKQLPVEEVWMMKLMSLALGVKYTKNFTAGLPMNNARHRRLWIFSLIYHRCKRFLSKQKRQTVTCMICRAMYIGCPTLKENLF